MRGMLLLTVTSTLLMIAPPDAKPTADGSNDASLSPLTIPIHFEFEAAQQQAPVQRQGGYQSVQPQPYQRRCGTVATDVCPTNVTVPAGATGEQLYQMAAQAEQQGRKGDALAYLQKSAEKGYARAQSAVGIDYADGKGMPRDPQKAVYYLGLAAAQGNHGAQAKLGEMYEHGDGVTIDRAKAIGYYQAAAAQHDTNAEFALGVDYEFGNGVAHNRAQAIQYLRRSSVDGHDTDGTDLANVLAKAPASRQFHNFDEISAYLHPPRTVKGGAGCEGVPTFTGTMNRFGFSPQSMYCSAHPGCPWQNTDPSGALVLHCPM